MSNKRREMIFRVMENHLELLPIMHYMTAWSMCDDFLNWLIQNRITGKNFLSWIHIRWQGNHLKEMCQFMEKRILKLDEYRPTILGQNWFG